MIKITHLKNNSWSQHEYFCDCCFEEIKYGEILWSEFGIDGNQFDLCSDCKIDWDKAGEENE